ncbi:MAG: zinc ribbon domain-containing protein [Nocardioides sp.]
MDQLFCTTCGHRLGADDLFCTACGARVAPSGTATLPVERATESPAERTAVREVHPVPTPAQPPVPHVRHGGTHPSPRRKRARFWGWIAVAAVAVGAVSYGLGTLVDEDATVPTNARTGSSEPTAPGDAPSGRHTARAAADPEAMAQAKALYALISQSASDKQRIAVAAGQLQRCDHIEQAIQTFADAAGSRDRLVEQAAGLEVGLLPGGGAAVADLSAAARAAGDADRAYVAWGESRHTVRVKVPHHRKHHGPRFHEVCRGGDELEARAVRLSSASHGAKQKTATAWNLVAAQFGLPTITWTEL